MKGGDLSRKWRIPLRWDQYPLQQPEGILYHTKGCATDVKVAVDKSLVTDNNDVFFIVNVIEI